MNTDVHNLFLYLLNIQEYRRVCVDYALITCLSASLRKEVDQTLRCSTHLLMMDVRFIAFDFFFSENHIYFNY